MTAVMELVVKGGFALGAAAAGFFLLPLLVAAITGVLAAVLDMVAGGTPAIITAIGTGQKGAPVLALTGAVLGAGWVVTR